MFRIDSSTAVATKPTKQSLGTPGYFAQGNPSAGVPFTTTTADWGNAIQEEIANVIIQAGITLSKTDDTQLFHAINNIVATGGQGANASIVTLQQNIAAEIAARIAGDNNASTDYHALIAAEASARNTQVVSEASTRNTQDAAEATARANADAAEATARNNADVAEATARNNADVSEANTRYTVDQQIWANFNNYCARSISGSNNARANFMPSPGNDYWSTLNFTTGSTGFVFVIGSVNLSSPLPYAADHNILLDGNVMNGDFTNLPMTSVACWGVGAGPHYAQQRLSVGGGGGSFPYASLNLTYLFVGA